MDSSKEPGKTKTVLVWCSWIAVAGGMERIAVAVANGLHANGWRVIFVGPVSPVPSFRARIAPGIEVVDHTPAGPVDKSIGTARFINRLISRYSVDVVSAHGSVLPLIACNAPVVWTEHEIRYGSRDMLSGAKGIFWRVIRGYVRSGRWTMVGVSRYLINQTCRKLNLDPCVATVIYNGIADADELSQLPPPKLDRPYRLGFLGRLVHQKNPLDVFALSEELVRMGVPHEWHVFGEGELLADLQARAKEADGRVLVRGPVKNAKDALAQLDMLVFLSRGEYEGFGLVLLEARLARRLVVAWNAGCMPEAAGDHAALVDPPFDLKNFASRIATELNSGRIPPPAEPNCCSVQTMVNEYDAVCTRAISRVQPRAFERAAL